MGLMRMAIRRIRKLLAWLIALAVLFLLGAGLFYLALTAGVVG